MPIKNNPTVSPKVTSSAALDGAYKLTISRLQSYETDSIIENGQQKNIHYVIKGSAFAIEIALRKTELTSSALGSTPDTPASTPVLDFTKITLEATLLYDCDKEERPVVQVRSRPLTTRGLVNPKSPSACRLETVVEALSSRHEDMSFKIKLAAVDMATKKKITAIPPVYTEPFQVISKPDVLLKKKQKSRKLPRKPTQTKQDQVLEVLQRIEAQQAQQQSQLNFLMSQYAAQAHQAAFHSFPHSESSLPLDGAFSQFVGAVNRIPKHERPMKLRKLFTESQPSDVLTFSETVDFLPGDHRVGMSAMSHTPSASVQPAHSADHFLSPSATVDTHDLGPTFDELLADLG